VKQISDNEIYWLIKYIKSVLWRVSKRLSYIEDTQCLKVTQERKMNEDFRKKRKDKQKHKINAVYRIWLWVQRIRKLETYFLFSKVNIG